MSLEAAKPGTPEHEYYAAIKSLRTQVDLMLGEMEIVLARLNPKDTTELAEVKAVIDDLKAKTAERLGRV